MSNFAKGQRINANEIKQLKAGVKAELLRRNKTGSLSAYGGSSWDFQSTPNKDGKILNEHYTKIVEPLSKINTSGLPSLTQSNIPSLDTTEARLETNKSQSGKSSTSHGCMGSCSGLCYSSCTSCTGCSGCSGCGGACSYGCSSCSGTCSGGCTSCQSCTGSCIGSCSGSCGSGCYLCSPTIF